jgi:microcystin-dependent protein
MANYEATKYNFNGSDLTGIEGTATGTILPWSAASLPTGFLECAGAAVSRSTYSALFAIISTTYGVGDGSSTFNLPNLADNVPVGKSGSKALASTGGANTVAVASSGNVSTSTNISGNVAGSTANASLSTAQLAGHAHSYTLAGGFQGSGGKNYNNGQSSGSSSETGQNGSGQGHSHNMSANFSGNASSSSSFSGGTANPSVIQPYITLIYIIKT